MDDTYNSDATFMPSITDLMTSLAVIFVLLLVGYIAKLMYVQDRLETVLHNLNRDLARVQTIKQELKQALAQAGYPTQDDPHDVLTITYAAVENGANAQRNNLRFEFGKDTLQPEGKVFLKQFVKTVVPVLCRDKLRDNIRSIIIEGHTDRVSDDRNPDINLKLSQDRAFAVMHFALKGCGLTNEQGKQLLDWSSMIGRGSRDPVIENGKENPDKSRRVVFKFRVKSFDELKLRVPTISEFGI